MTTPRVNRRRLLAALSTAGAGALAGCGALGGGTDPAAETAGTDGTDEATTAPSLPYEGPSPRALLDAPRGLRLRNAAGAFRFVTVALDHGDRQVFLDSRGVPPATLVTYDGLVRRRDDYRVVVETDAGGRHRREWSPTPWTGDLLVTLDRDVTSRATATCGPECGPGDPTADSDRALVLDNPADDPVTVDVRLGPSFDPDLARRYQVPGVGRLSLPVSRWSDDYPVRLAYGDRTVRHEWRTADGDRIYADVSGPPRLRCSNAHRDLVVVNRPAREREVGLRIEADGELAVERSLVLGPERRRAFANDVPPAGEYGFRIRTDDGLDESFSTSICPAPGRMLVNVDERAAVVTVRGAEPETVVDGRT